MNIFLIKNILFNQKRSEGDKQFSEQDYISVLGAAALVSDSKKS